MQRQHRRARSLQRNLGAANGDRRQGYFIEFGDRMARPLHRGSALGGAGIVFGLQQNRDLACLVAKVAFERVADRLRLRAGNVEAASGQVIGLVRSDRQGEHQDRDPRRQDPAAPAPQEPCKSDHELTHWLDSQPFERTASRL